MLRPSIVPATAGHLLSEDRRRAVRRASVGPGMQ